MTYFNSGNGLARSSSLCMTGSGTDAARFLGLAVGVSATSGQSSSPLKLPTEGVKRLSSLSYSFPSLLPFSLPSSLPSWLSDPSPEKSESLRFCKCSATAPSDICS